MKFALLLMSLMFVTHSRAAIKLVGVQELQASKETLVKTTTGEVLWVPAHGARLLAVLQRAFAEQVMVEVEFDERHTVHAARLSAEKSTLAVFDDEESFDKLDDEQHPPYSPTVLNSVGYMNQIHWGLDNRTHEDSQCYNRAHGWAYDMYRLHGVNSMKLFLFFTDRYIREYRHNWWFHVAPMVYTSDGYGTNEYVMDRSFSDNPVYPQVWTNIFMKNQAVCRSVDHWDQYRKDDPSEWCFLMRSTMYYRGTTGIKKRDRDQKWRTKWSEKEIREARNQAFIYAREYQL